MSTPSYHEWVGNWRLEQGREPTNEEISNLFVNAGADDLAYDAGDPAYDEWAERSCLKHAHWPTSEEINEYWFGDGVER